MIKSITLEIEATVEIEDAAYVAWRQCQRYGCPVRFDFNGIACEVKLFESHTHALDRYYKAMNERGRNNA